MPRLPYFAPSLFSLAMSIGLLSAAPALAQDLGTYRPGQAYQSVTAPGADVCNSHCDGDAQCSAWNYVKASPQAVGVCEFLSSASSPVPSQVSISGTNSRHTQYARPTLSGSSHTVRVGTSKAPSPKPSASVQATPTRRVVREAVPPRVNPSQANFSPSLTQQQNAYRRQTGELAPRQNPNTQPRVSPAQRQAAAARQGTNPRLDPRLQQQYQQQQYQQQQYRQQQYRQQQYQQQQLSQPRAPQFRPLLDGAGGVPSVAPSQGAAIPQQYAPSQSAPSQSAPSQAIAPQAYPAQNFAPQNIAPQSAAPSAQQNRQQRSDGRSQRRRQASRRTADARPPIGQPIGAVNSANSQNKPAANSLPPNPIPLSQAEAQTLRQGQGQSQSQSQGQGQAEGQSAQNRRAPSRRAQAPSSINLPRASASNPVTRQNAQAAFARRQADLAAIASGNSVDPISKSLYGTLNDDVKVPVAVKDIPLDHDLPIATAASRPVAPVSQEPLGVLAGGPR